MFLIFVHNLTSFFYREVYEPVNYLSNISTHAAPKQWSIESGCHPLLRHQTRSKSCRCVSPARPLFLIGEKSHRPVWHLYTICWPLPNRSCSNRHPFNPSTHNVDFAIVLTGLDRANVYRSRGLLSW